MSNITRIHPSILINQAIVAFDRGMQHRDFIGRLEKYPEEVSNLRNEMQRVSKLFADNPTDYAFTKFQKFWGKFDYELLVTIFETLDNKRVYDWEGSVIWDVYKLLKSAFVTAEIVNEVKYKKYKGFSIEEMQALEQLFYEINWFLSEKCGCLSTHYTSLDSTYRNEEVA